MPRTFGFPSITIKPCVKVIIAIFICEYTLQILDFTVLFFSTCFNILEIIYTRKMLRSTPRNMRVMFFFAIFIIDLNLCYLMFRFCEKDENLATMRKKYGGYMYIPKSQEGNMILTPFEG